MDHRHHSHRPAASADATPACPGLPELRLARIPLSSQPRYLGDRWSYLESGRRDGPAIVLLHGIGAHAAHFRFQLAGLGAQARVLAWNAPGYMLSDALASTEPQASDYAQAVADFLEATDVERCLLVGHSFGSAAAQAFAIAHPHRVVGMVLSGTGVGQRAVAPERRDAYQARVRRIRAGGYQYADGGIDHLVGPGLDAGLRSLVTEVARGLRPEGVERAAAFRLSSFFSPDQADRLAMPVLLIQGSEDRINPREQNADLLLPRLPHGELQVWQGIGHLPEVEAAGRFNDAVLALGRACGHLPA